MLRKLLFPVAAGFLAGKAIKLVRDRRYVHHHPTKSLFVKRA